MARLIPQKQIEEINIFKNDITVNNNVIVSGSLLVSQSIEIGTDPLQQQQITGSVQITGSLTVDGPLELIGQQELDATASFARRSIETDLFGGLTAQEFGANDTTIYVSSTSGNDENDGRTPQFPVRTVKRAAQLAQSGDDGRFGLPTGSLSTGFRIEVAAGTYLEDNPIELPKNTTVWGAGLRVCKILAKNENEDLFWVNSGNYLAEMTFGNLRCFPSVDNAKSGFAVSFAPNAFITTSPYVQNCSMISNQENSFLELYEDIPAGGGGLNVDGNRIHPDSPLASMVLDAYTQVAPNGVGCQVVGRGFIQLVSFFTNFSAYAVKVLDGGQAVLLNSNTSFGDFGMFASGSRFITGSGGNVDAFNIVRNNYTIIIDTIEDGLSSIPELITNTEEGIKTTDELQVFISGNSSDEVAEQVKSEYRLISSLIDNGISSVPNLLAKSSTQGYDTGSVFNISGGNQITSSVTATSASLSLLNENFKKFNEVLEDGTRATASYEIVDNTDGYIKFNNISQYKTSAVTSTTTDTSNANFNIVLNIVENGVVNNSTIPDKVENSFGNIKVGEVPQFGTDISSSKEVETKISSSFSIIYTALNETTESLPQLVTNTSTENASIDYQSAYFNLLGNVDFIKEETRLFISSSWSENQYSESALLNDIENYISGAATDLLFGGNEQSYNSATNTWISGSGNDYQTKNIKLTAIKYAGELSRKVVGDIEFVDSSVEVDNAHDLILNNKDFIRSESISYISSSWEDFEYDEVKCKRDIGFILDAVATDIRYGGNERSITAGEFYYDYPSDATETQLVQTLDTIKYAKRITKNLLENQNFVTASSQIQSVYNLIRDNKELIKTETINFVNTEFPRFIYNETDFSKDLGYVVDSISTDLYWGGNERTLNRSIYYNTEFLVGDSSDLDKSKVAVDYTKAFIDEIVQNNIISQSRVIRNTDGRVRATSFTPTTSSISGTQTQATLISSSFSIVEDIIKQGDDAVLASIAANTPGQFDWGTNIPVLVTGINQLTSSVQISSSFTQSISTNFDTIVTIIESGSSVTTDVTIGSASNGLPISQVGIPKDSYGDNLITTVTGTILPSGVSITSSLEGNIKVNNDIQFTSSISASNEITSSVSSSFSIITDIIEYGISGSQVISGSSDTTTYFEVVTLPSNDSAFYFNKNQLQEFDDLDGRDLGEDTGSFDDGVKDPTITLLRNEMYTFSVNDLGSEDTSINVPFLIKTRRTAGYDNTYDSVGLINNGIKFGTITFTPLPDTPDTLYYVNPNNVSASGVIQIVDSLPLSSEQEFVYIPTKGEIEKIPNTIDNIKITTGSQYTASLKAIVGDRNTVSQSFDTVINILNSGSSISPAVTESVDSLTKTTLFSQYTSSLSASLTQVQTVSSSFAIVLDIIENGTGSLPTKIENTEEFIKVGSVSQFTTSSISGSVDDISFISESFEIVSRIVEFGSGSYPSASSYTTLISSSTTVAAYNLIKENIDFIQEETIAYLSSSWSTASYNEVSYSQDIGNIVNGVAEDLIYNEQSSSVYYGKLFYEEYSGSYYQDLNRVLDGIGYASRLAQNLASNITYVTSSQDRLTTKDLIVENKEFIQEEAISYLSASWSEFDYNEVTCKRDIGFILDATVTDIVYGGNERSINAGEFYYRYPSEATGSQLSPTLTGIKYAGDITQKIIQNNLFTSPSVDTQRGYELLSNNRNLIQDEVILYLSASWSDFEYDDVKCRRDVGYIIDAAATDLLYGGNERSVEAGEFYYRFPSEATSSQKIQTIDGVRYAQRLADKVMGNILLVTASIERQATYDLIYENKGLIQNEVISYISSSWSEFEYSEAKCRRDTGYILDAVATDILYGGNERSVTAGEFYYLYPSLATVDAVDQSGGQKDQTIDGINHAEKLVQKLIKNTELVQPTSQSFAVWNSIRDNRQLIQKEVTELIDYKYPYFTYNQSKCQRDVGFILDAIATDVLWGGNERSVIAGDFYYRYPSQATTFQLRETVDGIRYAETLVNTIIQNEIIETPRIIYNTENNIKVTDNEVITGSIALSGSYITEVSSSFETIINIVSGGLDISPMVVENVDGLIKVTDATQVTGSNTGSSVEVGLISQSIKLINEIIELGSDRIPFAIAKYYDDDLSQPQNLTTGSYVTASGIFTSASLTDELQTVSSSFGEIISIIENGTGSLPTLAKNTDNIYKFGNQTQFTSSLSGSTTEIAKVSESVGIVENIVQNGISAIPSIILNNSDTSNLIKVTDVEQFTTSSGATKLQSKLVSSSFALITTALRSGTGSLPDVVEYENETESSETQLAYTLIQNNLDFITSESIAYISSSWSTQVYNEVSYSQDIRLIVSGAAEDMIFNSNSSSIQNAKIQWEENSGSFYQTINRVIDGIEYAGRITQQVVRNREFISASVDVSASVELIKNNKEFIQEETIEFISSSWSNFDYNSVTCKRDIGFILDAVTTDILYGGNERSVTAGEFYYDYPSSAIVGGVPSSTQQKDPTVTAIDFVQGLVTEIVGGSVFVTQSAEVNFVYDSIRLNREFIQDETIAFVNAKYPRLNYNEASCSRDTGFIVDAVATDLRWGGNQRSITAGEFYYLFPSKATGVQVEETTDALVYTKGLIEKITLQEDLFIPTASKNTDNLIKVTNTPQTTGAGTSNETIIGDISASFAIVTNTLINGTGSLPSITPYGPPETDADIVSTYNLIKDNISFIQSETIAYLSSSWSDFNYNQESCSRDIGYIVSGAAEDLLHNSVSASVVNAKFYFEYPSEATSSQLEQTVDGIEYAAGLTNEIIQGGVFQFPSIEKLATQDLITQNKGFIQSESIAYLSSSWEGFEYNQETCKRDIGYILDAIKTDIVYGGNERSVTAGEFYYKYPSTATTTQLFPTQTGIKYAGDLAEKLIQNNTFQTASNEKVVGNQTLLNNKKFIQDEVIQYISSSWSTFEYNDVSCSRDTGFIVNAVATDFLYGGNERSVTAGEFYYEYPSEATTTQLVQTIDGINYARGLAEKVIQNTTFITASAEVSASFDLLRKNREFIQEETIAYISSSWSGVTYNEEKCKRDVGYIIDAAATDLRYGGNERSVTAGLFYWLYPSRATNKGVPSEQNQLDPTVDGIRFAGGTAENVIQNLEYTTPSTEVLNGIELLRSNKTLIQKETIAFLSSSWSEFEYNEVSCSRDLGYILDAVATDVKYGGNERAIKAATFYYYIPSVAITEQKPQTIDGIDFAKGISEKIVKQDQLVFANIFRRRGADALRSAKKDLQAKAISYTNAAFPNFEYNEEKCYRDTGFILDAIATDIIYGGNERSIEAAQSYYNGVYGDASVVVNEQKKETAETNRYLRTQFQFVARQSPTEEFGSLIITTGHDFSYAGSGVTYKALPPNQGGDGVPDPDKEIVEIDGGRVFFTSGNELGDFRIGAGLVINQATGTLQGRTFSRSLFSLVTPFSLALQD